jgi:hypothetical protein
MKISKFINEKDLIRLINSELIDWNKNIGKTIDFKYGDINGFVTIIKYDDIKHRIFFKYNSNTYDMNITQFRNAGFGKILKVFTREYRFEIGSNFINDKNNITIINRKHLGSYKKYQYRCNKCGYDNGWIDESNLKTNSFGCAACCSSPKTVVEGINDIPTTDPWMIKYFQGGYDEAKMYTFSSNKKIKPICPECGKIKNQFISISNIYKNKSIGCVCSDNISIPNKIIRSILQQFNIIYVFNELEFEYSPSWIKPYRYDSYFSFNDKKYIIEMDGGFGHGNKSHGKLSKTDEELIEIDRYKDLMAYSNEIKVIRIDCNYANYRDFFGFIKNNILSSFLSEVLDFNKVDWEVTKLYCTSNQIKDVCDYFNKYTTLTNGDIGKIFLLHRKTIGKYLKIGNELGWCNYTSEIKERHRLTSLKSNTKKVICTTTNELFNSVKTASIYYNINYESLRSCCLGVTKTSGKMKWRYFDELNDNISSFLLPKFNQEE